MITINKWSDFQHYKNRTPPWIKLHRSLLDNMEYRQLSDGAARFLIDLWLFAAEEEKSTGGGVITKDINLIAWRLRDASKKIADYYVFLKELNNQGFISIDSDMLAECLQHATPETETETETETEKHLSESVDSDDFDEFWELYPRKDSKKKAALAWKRLSATKRAKAISDIKTRYIGIEKQFIPMPTTYINGERWDDSPIPREGSITPSAMPWHETATGIRTKGKELNIFESDFELFPDFRAAVFRAAGYSPSSGG